MNAKEFFKILRESINDLISRPLLVIPALVLWAVLFGISQAGGSLAHNLTTTEGNIGWSILVSLVSLVLVSFVSAGMISMVKNKKSRWDNFLEEGRKFTIRNFFVILIIVVVSILIFWISFGLAYGIGRTTGLQAQSAGFLFALIYFIGLVGVSIFFTFASFYLVIEDLKVGASLRKSFRLVAREYLATLSLLVILFVLGYLFNLIPGVYGEILIYLLIVPFVIIVMSKFVLRAK